MPCTIDGNAGDGTEQGTCNEGQFCHFDGKCKGWWNFRSWDNQILFELSLKFISDIYISIYVTTFVGDHVVTALGRSCTEERKISVFDEDECMSAAISLGKNFGGAAEHADYPRGCYFWVHNNNTIWNFHKTGHQHLGCAEICQKTDGNFKLLID